MIVRFSPHALRRMKVIGAWWRSNRLDAPTLFDDELGLVIEKLKKRPSLGVEHELVRGKMVRRLLLRKTNQNVFYTVDQAHGVIVIYSIWGARRGSAPTL